MKKNESKLVKYTLIAICLIFVFLFLVLPLYIVFAEAFRDGIEKYREAVTDKYTISAVLLTLEATVFAVVVNTVFGVFASWAITKFNFKGKKFLTTLIDLPVTISPIIAGLIFVLTFGRQSILYQENLYQFLRQRVQTKKKQQLLWEQVVLQYLERLHSLI